MKERPPEVRLSMREHERLKILNEVREGRRRQVWAASVMGLTDRWVRELIRRVQAKGPAGLIHGNRGRPSNHRMGTVLRQKIVQLYRDPYADFNLTHFREMLEHREQIQAPSRETLRKILLEAGCWSRKREAPKHRLRRPRRQREGELLQMDASLHAWFGPQEPVVALVGAIDDATGQVPSARFFEAETTEAYFGVLRDILGRQGIPQALYTDRDSVFVVNTLKDRESAQAQGRVPLTQFGRALQELGIQWIPAYSPQAKGRIERLWGTFQDRLLNELRLEGIRKIEPANDYLRRTFLPGFNRTFRRPAAINDPMYRPAPLRKDREAILCFKESRTLPRDHTFTYQGSLWQVLPSDDVLSLTGKRIEIRKTLRGELQAWYGPYRLSIRPGPQKPPLASLRRAIGARAPLAAASSIPKGGLLL